MAEKTPPTAHPFQETQEQMERKAMRPDSAEFTETDRKLWEMMDHIRTKVDAIAEQKAAHSEALKNGKMRFQAIEAKLDKIMWAVWAVVALHIIKTLLEI